jgi:hypothetical protein
MATLSGDGVDHRRAMTGVPPVHDHIGAVPGQLFSGGSADARSCPGDQRGQALEVSLLAHVVSFPVLGPA